MINPLKLRLFQIILKDSVHTTKKTQFFTIKKIDWLMFFKEIITAYIQNHAEPINAK
jgi:hypothetical protein